MINYLIHVSLGLASWQYLILFSIVVIEGPIATVVAGFLVAQGNINFYLAYPLVVIADLVGDTFYYSIGRWGRKFGFKIFRIKNEKFKELEKRFNENSGKAMLIGKAAHGFGGAFIFIAGVARMPYGKFLFYNAIASIPKSLILLLAGYFFGESYLKIGKYLDYYSYTILALGIIILISYIFITKKIKKKNGL